MQYPHLTHHSIFVIPAEEYLPSGRATLLYAPLTGYVMKVTPADIQQLENAAARKEELTDPSVQSHLDHLCNLSAYGKSMYSVTDPGEYLLLYILPNYICNFSCSYCFSAQGRSDKELSKEELKAALDYFIDSNRIREKKLFITFLGGGEPTLSWELLKFGITYIHTRASAEKIDVTITLVINGSVLSTEMLQTFVTHNVRIRISFEVLEEIQNRQRGSYKRVCQSIDRLSAAGVYLQVRAMITPLNVERMVEMVQELADRFPGVEAYLFDPVTDKHIFCQEEETRSFYKKYQQHFFRALDLARQQHKQLKCALSRNLDSIVLRYCYGELCLTPEATFTICHRVSTPADERYTACTYGKIDPSGRLVFDREKFGRLIRTDTIHDNPDCKTCFLQWNCGGGCMVQNREYNPAIRKVICEFTRNFSTELLVRKLGSAHAGHI